MVVDPEIIKRLKNAGVIVGNPSPQQLAAFEEFTPQQIETIIRSYERSSLARRPVEERPTIRPPFQSWVNF